MKPLYVGLFSSDPWSARVSGLESAFQRLGVDILRIIPWMVSTRIDGERQQLVQDNRDLSSLDAVLVVDLGGIDIGTFFNRVAILTSLQDSGVNVINSVASILQMRNKAECMRRLVAAQVPTPETLITESIDEAAKFVRDHFPCVLKPITGFGGIGVQLIERDFDLKHIEDYLKFHSQLFGKGAYLLQDYIHGAGFDIRALVLDDEVVGSMQRVSAGGFVTNIHSGGIPRKNDVDVEEIAVKSARAVRGRLVGVDIIPDSDGSLFVLEVNATPGWAGLQRVLDFSLPDRIAEVIADSLKQSRSTAPL